VAVIVRQDTPGDQRLVAYLTGDALAQESLREHCRGKLPEHMVPSAFVVLPMLPLNQNGKIDRQALPAPEQQVSETYVAPRNDEEQQLAEIFAELLGV